MIKDFLKKNPIAGYYLIAIAFPTVLFSYMMVLEVVWQSLYGVDQSYAGNFYSLRDRLIEQYNIIFHHNDSVVLYVTGYIMMPLAAPFFFFPFAPTCAAVITTALTHGKAAIKALLRLYKPVQGSVTGREGLRIYGLLLVTLAVMVVVVCLREYYFGNPERVDGFLTHLGLIDPVIFLSTWLMGLFVNQGALLEELGWRGYALPLMIRKVGNPLKASILVGVLWCFWHFPREVPSLLSGAQGVPDLLIGQLLFLISCCSMSVVAGYFVNITGGSVLPAIMLHGSFNLVGGMFSSANVGARGGFTLDGPLMWLATAVVLVLIVGKDLDWRRRLEAHGGDGSTDPSLAWCREN
ncbi:MAG: CPBP family intramembrane metalloprotease [Deltaproteobacteria bacterium]|nr:CPBP family intramembrane metalloprotease [Deltaproteobacteria bacterium]